MRRFWFRRRAVSTMIGGVIVLGLFLTALAAMIILTQQYDSYQQTVDTMKQADMNKFSENLGFVSPGLVKFSANPRTISGTPCASKCNMYTMIVNDYASNGSVDVGVQIARIYINSSQIFSQSGCVSLCVFEPSSTPSPYVFNASQRYVNPGEFQHNVTLWLPSSVTLPDTDSNGNSAYSLNTISIVTTRGRQFSFVWPAPPTGFAAGATGGGGGTGIYIGPLVITFQKDLISYTDSNSCNPSCAPQFPIGGKNGYWVVAPPPFVIYVKIQTDRGTASDVYMTAQSVLELARFDNPGNVLAYFVIAPITPTLCAKFAAQDNTVHCNTTYGGTGYGYYANGNTGDPNNLVGYSSCSSTPYSSCPNRYRIPRPSSLQLLNNERGDPVIVAFAANTASGSGVQNGNGGFSGGVFATSFLGLTYVYNDLNQGLGDYTYAVTLPFIAVCFDTANSNGSSSPCEI